MPPESPGQALPCAGKLNWEMVASVRTGRNPKSHLAENPLFRMSRTLSFSMSSH